MVNRQLRIPVIIWAPLLCFLLNMLLLAWIDLNRPEYLRDYRLNTNPDAPHYVLLGRNLLLRGQYSRASEAPYVQDVFRTPGYPLFVGALDVVGGAFLIYLAQALLQSINCAIIYTLTRKLFGPKAALLASLLCATDLMLAVMNFQTMSEPLYVFVLSVSALVLLPRIVAEERGRSIGFLFGGILLGVATHVRPAGLYLPLVYAVVTWAVGWLRGYRLKALADAAMVIVGAALLLVPWIVRNQTAFGIARLTTSDTILLVYFTGAGAYQVHHGVDLHTAQRMIAQEFDLRPPEELWNYWNSDFSPKELDDQLQAAAPSVLGKYPFDLVKASMLGIMKASVSHNAKQLAEMMGKPWTSPGLGRILRLDSLAISKLFENHPGLVMVFVWEVLHAVCVVSLALFALIWAIGRRESRIIGIVLVVLLAFFLSILGASGLEAFSRFRSPLMPLAYVAAGCLWAVFYPAEQRRLPLGRPGYDVPSRAVPLFIHVSSG